VPSISHYEALRHEVVRLLREERKRRNLSNYAVSQRSGVSESMLSLVERGLRNPTMELMLRIADGIGVDLDAAIKKAKAKATNSRKPALKSVQKPAHHSGD
jgi:transcriptional regulator with XRE-family HTH domain